MRRRVIRRVARFTVNLCDIMNGYIGNMIEELLVELAFVLPTVFFFTWFLITMS